MERGGRKQREIGHAESLRSADKNIIGAASSRN
jgi:hypothetical protein